VAHDPRQLRPTELCRLLNSTPLGEVVKQRQMQEHRVQAGLRIGTHKHVDLFRYVVWLVQERHLRPKSNTKNDASIDLPQLAQDVAFSVNHSDTTNKLNAKQEAFLAALLTEPTYSAAATRVGVSRMTAYRWLRTKEFKRLYQRARQELVNTAVGRLQLGSGLAVDALMSVVVQSRRDSDRVRAAVVILDHAYRGLSETELLAPSDKPESQHIVGTAEIVTHLGMQLRQLEQSTLTTKDKSRLTATLADALLRAIGVDVIDKRLEALESVLVKRKKQT
jgi:hypothetical protein